MSYIILISGALSAADAIACVNSTGIESAAWMGLSAASAVLCVTAIWEAVND